MSFIKTYLNYQKSYTAIHGLCTVVFIQKGTFYEAYSTTTEGFNLKELENLVEAKLTRSNTKIKPLPLPNNNNPNMLGFPVIKLYTILDNLTKAGYIVPIFDEVVSFNNNHEKIITREIKDVYSLGTFVSDNNSINNSIYLLSAYIVEERQLQGAPNLLAIGLTLIDIVTSNTIVHEFYSKPTDINFGLDELFRIIQIFKPNEAVIYYQPLIHNEKEINTLKTYLELDTIPKYYFCIYHNKEDTSPLLLITEKTFKINYQNTYLSNIYDLSNKITLNKKSAIEILSLERKSYATISLIVILKFLSKYNVNVLTNLSLPTHYIYNKYLILGNNAIDQLNVIGSNNLPLCNTKITSLFDVVNKTTTVMGRRLLKYNLSNPLSQENKQIINNRYNIIDEIINNNLTNQLVGEMKNIYDIERLHRKMAIGIITPKEFINLDQSYQSLTKLITIVKQNDTITDMIDNLTIKKFCNFQIEYNKVFIIDELENFPNLEKSFFHKDFNTIIDTLQDKIDITLTMVTTIANYFIQAISSTMKNKKNTDNLIITKRNDDGSYYFSITKTREKILKNFLKNKKTIMINDSLTINVADIDFRSLRKGNTKIFIASIDEQTSQLHKRHDRMIKLIKNLFMETMMGYYEHHHKLLQKISNFVAELDFLTSGAISATEYYYCKPTIVELENNKASYIEAKQLRHPIIERLCCETEYIPNDIEIGATNNKNGILLYGLNFGGKSSLMKSIGLAVILAQIGYFVPAKEFIYEPYMAIYARINANDNILKGLSSFILEMTELDAILKRIDTHGANTMVIGDEVCRGTEIISATAIVASTIVQLSEANTTFIFSSHLHELSEIEEIVALPNLRLFYLKVNIDEENNLLVFERKLTPGIGPKNYGVAVAKYMIKNPKFINTAEIIKNRIMNSNITEFPEKNSNYNSKLIVYQCAICQYKPTEVNHKELETHHINFQKDCTKNGKILEKQHLNKDGLYNLVILCRQCHNKVHTKKIMINSYKETSSGPKLDWYEKKIEKKISK